MKIWIFNNYSSPPELGPMARSYNFGKYFKRMGHEPIVFSGSHIHNTDKQMIAGKERYIVYQEEPFPWVFVKICNYGENKIKRVFSMFQYFVNTAIAVRHFEKPDVIIGSSAHPLAPLLAILLSKKYNCKSIVEIRDLWPESIVAYGIASAKNPLVLALRHLEHWMYVHCDEIIFLMEGAYDYIVEQGWEKDVSRKKVHFINNGVDLEQFNYNKKNFVIKDEDLENQEMFKVVYAGSLRKVNNIGRLLDVAKIIKSDDVLFLIWGAGNEEEELKQRAANEKITNVKFKGYVEKKYIPYVTSRADLNISLLACSPMIKYGISFNKLFEYAAAGKPILLDFYCKYNPANDYKVAVLNQDLTIEEIANVIKECKDMDKKEFEKYSNAAKLMANEYDFSILAKRAIDIIRGA